MRRRLGRIPAARIGVAVGFMLSGIAFASWVVRIPDVQARLQLSEGALGLVLLAVACGGLAAMPLSAALVGRFGSRSVARGAALALAGSVALPPRLSGVWSLAAGLLVLGAATSILSVALNTQAAALERRMRRPIMAGLHALYSVGGLIGAGLGGIAAGVGVGAATHLTAAAVLVAGVTLLITPSLLGSSLEGGIRGPGLIRPDRPLALMGLVAFCVLFGEGAVADWSAVYLRDVIAAGPAMAAAGYAAYSTMMAGGRFVGDRLTIRLGERWLVRLGAATATVGILLALGGWTAWVSVLGFAAVGAGLSSIYPTVLAAAGRVQGTPPASSIAVVSSMGYVGLLAGPPLIGFAAEATSLQLGFSLVGIATALIVALAEVVPQAERAAAPTRGLPVLPRPAP